MTNGQEARPQIDASTHESTAQRKARVEGELRALQDANRLGIHMWESYDPYTVPEKSLGDFRAVHAHEITKNLQSFADKGSELISCSLLPAAQTGRSIYPYSEGIGTRPSEYIGYLVDFDQSQSNPPKVLRVLERSLASGKARTNKVLHFRQCSSRVPEIQVLYDGVDESEFVQRVVQEKEGEWTNRQLDALGKSYDHGAQPEPTTDYNEVICSASTDHLKAIVVPDRSLGESENVGWGNFAGAFAGLQHAKNGLILPIVRYHLNGKKTGKIECLAQTPEEMKSLLVQSLYELNAQVAVLEKCGEHPARLMTFAEDLLGEDLMPLVEAYGQRMKESGCEKG